MSESDQTDKPVMTAERLADPADTDHVTTYLGVDVTTKTDGGTYMVTAGGEVVPVPPDLPQRATRYQTALETGRQIATVTAGIFLPEIREFMGFVRHTYENDPYALGGDLYEHGIAVEALEAFRAVIDRGRAADLAHRQARTTPPAEGGTDSTAAAEGIPA